jgi:hypothetical protein
MTRSTAEKFARGLLYGMTVEEATSYAKGRLAAWKGHEEYEAYWRDVIDYLEKGDEHEPT